MVSSCWSAVRLTITQSDSNTAQQFKGVKAGPAVQNCSFVTKLLRQPKKSVVPGPDDLLQQLARR
jgi:hypothetical protein